MRFVLLSLVPMLLMLATVGCATTSAAVEMASDLTSETALDEATAKRMVHDELIAQGVTIPKEASLVFYGEGNAVDGFHYTVFVTDSKGGYSSHWQVQVHPNGGVGVAPAW